MNRLRRAALTVAACLMLAACLLLPGCKKDTVMGKGFRFPCRLNRGSWTRRWHRTARRQR